MKIISCTLTVENWLSVLAEEAASRLQECVKTASQEICWSWILYIYQDPISCMPKCGPGRVCERPPVTHYHLLQATPCGIQVMVVPDLTSDLPHSYLVFPVFCISSCHTNLSSFFFSFILTPCYIYTYIFFLFIELSYLLSVNVEIEY